MAEEQNREVILEWPARIRMLGNRNLWFGFLIGMAIPCMLMGVFLRGLEMFRVGF